MPTDTATATRIGFVGLGNMGGNMAARFLAAGYPVYGEERNHAHAEGLVHDGLQWRDTPREVADAAEIVFTSGPDDDVMDTVASGPDGILAGLAAGQIWVDMSTVRPHASRELAERVRAQGAAMLDAPVSGSVPQVQTGTLTVMVGGDEHAYARRCRRTRRGPGGSPGRAEPGASAAPRRPTAPPPPLGGGPAHAHPAGTAARAPGPPPPGGGKEGRGPDKSAAPMADPTTTF